MSVESFLQELGEPQNADIEPVEKKFLEAVKDRIQAVSAAYDETAVQKESDWLRGYHKDFFDFSIEWTKRELKSHAGQKNHPDAAALKKEAQGMLSSLQVSIVEFALSYMHINRFFVLLREEIRKEEIKLGADVNFMKWSSDVGEAIVKYRRRKRDLLTDIENLGKAKAILEGIEPDIDNINSSLTTLFGGEKAIPLTRSLISSFRTSDDVKVRKTLKLIKDTKKRFGVDGKTYQTHIANIEKAVGTLQKVFAEQKDVLSGDDERLYLRPIETDLAYNGKVTELKQIKGFLAKYHLPYMQSKLDNLGRLKEKMLVIGSLEGLMTLYKQLLAGLARPLATLEDIRAYEDATVNKAKYLLGSHFQEISNIHRDAEKVVQEFRKGREEFEQMEKMKLETIDGVEEKVAKSAI